MHTLMSLCLNKAYAQYFETVFCSSGCSGPKVSHPVSMLSGLGDITWVNGNRLFSTAFTEIADGKVTVETQPVGLAAEQIAVSLLVTLSETPHLRKIDALRHNQI